MKRKKGKYFCVLALVVLATLFSGCTTGSKGDANAPNATSTPEISLKPEVLTECYSNLVAQADKEYAKNILAKANLSNIDTFLSWVQDYNAPVKESAGLAKGWSPISQISYKEDELFDAWDESHNGANDSNCRLTAFLLLQDLIKGEPLTDYGTYLMMDVDEIKNNPQYAAINEELGKFIALYDQVSVANAKADDDYINAFPNAWKERGIAFPDGKASMISVVMNDSADKALFIGHTGVLIQEDGYLLFIEKLAPTMPYQLTKYANREILSKTLLARPEYTLGDEDFHTFLLENNESFSA